MREEGRNRNKTWGILKYLSAEISYEKSDNFLGQRTRISDILGQKMGYDSPRLELHLLFLMKNTPIKVVH